MEDLEALELMNQVDLSKVETDFPIPASGVITAQIVECAFRKDESKGADAKPFCEIKYNFTQPWKTQSIDGSESKPILPGGRGSSITERVYVGYYNDKKTGEQKTYGVDRLALLRECVLGKAQPGQKFVPAELVGQSVTIKLQFEAAPKNEKTGEIYGPRTSVSGYVRPKR